MNSLNLIVTVSLALIVGRSFGSLAQAGQAPGSAPGSAPGVSMNDATNGALPTSDNATSVNNATYARDPNSLNGTVALNNNATYASDPNSLNGTVALNTSMASNSAWGNYNTSLVGNSTTTLGSNTTATGVYFMNNDIYWSTSNFSVYDRNGTVTYQITKQEGMNITEKEFVVLDAITGQKKLKIDATAKHCGFGQTYEADDGTTFRVDPRAFLSDRWYIKNPSSETDYVYKRGALSVDGKIYENERVVAQVEVKSGANSTSVSTKQMTLNTDGTIPPWDLIALMAVVRTRIRACGY